MIRYTHIHKLIRQYIFSSVQSVNPNDILCTLIFIVYMYIGNSESMMYAHMQYQSVECMEKHENETDQTSTSNLMSRQNYLLGLNGRSGF